MARVSIEDCLKNMPNRFALVTIAASRTRQMMEGAEPLVKTKNKLGVTALREIAEGLISGDEPQENPQAQSDEQNVDASAESAATNGSVPPEQEPSPDVTI